MSSNFIARGTSFTPSSASASLDLPLVSDCARVADMLVIALTAAAIYYFYVQLPEIELILPYAVAVFLAMLILSVCFTLSGLYRSISLVITGTFLRKLFMGFVITWGILVCLAFALKMGQEFSRVWAFSWFITAYVGIVIARAGLTWGFAAAAKEGRFAKPTVIYGMGEQGQRLAEHLKAHAAYDVKLLGFIDDRTTRCPDRTAGLPRLGGMQQLLQFVRSSEVEQVYIALPWYASERIKQIAEALYDTPVFARLAPDMVGHDLAEAPPIRVSGLPMLGLLERPLGYRSRLLKSFEDFTLATLLLIFLAPLMALVAVAIKLTSPGPALFKQRRLGFNDQLIDVYKFRTMYVDHTDLDAERQTTRNDPRVTPVGAVLRRFSIDELPQLFNVLNGTMSIVGPRPHALATKAAGILFQEAVKRYSARHRVKPGITGWAQVNGLRGETDTTDKIVARVQYDLFYIEHWSLWFDLLILLKTIPALLFDRRAY